MRLDTLFAFLLSTGANSITPAAQKQSLNFELRHLHAVSADSHILFSDVHDHHSVEALEVRPAAVWRPESVAAVHKARTRSRMFGQSEWVEWSEDKVVAPDVESRKTLLLLAKMTNNAYVPPDDPAWYDIGSKWNVSYPFGWEPDADGFRGHIFATPDNKTVVLSIKGTSAGMFGSGGPTVKKDKTNDNLLFSCCCARVDWTWTTVCGCWKGGWKCNQDCLEDALIEDSLFYNIGTNLYNNVTYMYPDSNIWIIGHSLGGALASLLGATFGTPVVTFESPGDRRAASRLHLPSPPSTHHITHVYHTADPIAMGTCNGVLSSCALGGYAMETRCHLGRSIVYDTVSNLSWAVDIRLHGIVAVIDRLLGEPWAPSVESGARCQIHRQRVTVWNVIVGSLATFE
ncbi:alpha/beta-hydrolase [Infundibulicybe gibba]|nr:alpha/beta-hydrolase [Infundibulicybe gibba]